MSSLYLSTWAAVVRWKSMHRLHIALQQYALVHRRSGCLCWEWNKSSSKHKCFGILLLKAGLKKPNLLQSVKPESYQHCPVKAAMHIHTNTFFSWDVTSQLRSQLVARSLLLCQSILFLLWIVPFLKWEQELFSVPSNTICSVRWLDASLRKINSIKQAIIPLHY